MAPVCRARLLSDLSGQTACDKPATSSDGRLCAFHIRQCQALYRGYKKRNARLDDLLNDLPAYLAETKISLVVHEFQDIYDENILNDVHKYLFSRYNLLDRVIRARKLHHSHFYAIDNDYGHEKYLTKLQNEKHVMSRALERLGRRGAQIMYGQKEWIDWVQERQDDEESKRETEGRKVKLEALLFKRHQKEVERHQREMRAKEKKESEEEFLEEAYTQRISDLSEEDQDNWDPVRDVFGYERDNYVELINFFLMFKDQSDIENEPTANPISPGKIQEDEQPEKPLSKSAKKRAKKVVSDSKRSTTPTQGANPREVNSIEMESKTATRERLLRPVKYERPKGWYLSGTDSHANFEASYPPLPAEEVEVLLHEIAEVKKFLLCRLLLSHASLLHIALEAESIEQFLENDNVTQEHLRDLCLKLERPPLQDVRDACADFIRGENEDEENNDPSQSDHSATGIDGSDDEKEKARKDSKRIIIPTRKRRMPDKYQTKRERAAKNDKKTQEGVQNVFEDGQDVVDFGEVANESDYSRKKMHITICGMTMYNYPSEKALNRGGWFHFSIIAKTSNLFDAIELCRNWNEFFELNILSMYHYFPAAKWTNFVGDILRQQLLQLGFIPYFLSDNAEQVSHHFQTGSRGMARRSHQILEMRNFICGHIKRDDPVSRRFIQYLSMETWDLRVLVRDPTNGRILIQPPDDELWLIRSKSGWGRASRNDFEIISEVGGPFFEKLDTLRKWHFSFEEYYDVYLWDANSGRPYVALQRKLEEVLARAIRVREIKDMFTPASSILKTIVKEPKTNRVRSIKTGEETTSIWDSIVNGGVAAWRWSPRTGEMVSGLGDTYKYTEADALEDALLFAEEESGDLKDDLFKAKTNALQSFEDKPSFDLRRWANDLDSDDSLSSSDEGEDIGEFEEDGNEDWSDEKSSEDDGDYEYILGSENEVEDTMTALSERFKTMSMSVLKDPDYFLSILRAPAAAYHIPSTIRSSPRDLMAALRLSLSRVRDYSNTSPQAMEADFFRHIDREKSKVFKHCWHLADAEPDAIVKYYGFKVMVGKMDDYVMQRINSGPFELCKFMRLADQFVEERRIVNDAFDAYACIALFFDMEPFLYSEEGQAFRGLDTADLFDQAKRAQRVPNRRTHMSNHTRPKEFWDGFDQLLRDNGRKDSDANDDIYPDEWRNAIRPVLIRLFRAGIIYNSYLEGATGLAVAQAEEGRPRDFYIDFRRNSPPMRAVSHLADPTVFDRDYLLAKAAAFADGAPNARFSVLRLWSAPHFYPLMLGIENRQMSSFLDDRGRAWCFRFMPKDMPFSEWSIHQQLSLRLQPYGRMFGSNVIVAKDMALVMGKDKNELRRLSEGVTFAIQTRPWRLEVDFWRSFVNVDVQFLENMNPKWLE